MFYLSIDTVSAQPSVAVTGDEGGYSVSLPSGRGQSQALLEAVKTCLKATATTYHDLNGLIVLTGPGSFTGIRVGLSFLKGVALSLDIPLYGLNHFQSIVKTVTMDVPYLIALEAGRDEKFFCFAQSGDLITAPINCDVETLKQFHKDRLSSCKAVVSDFSIDGVFPNMEEASIPRPTAEMAICYIQAMDDGQRQAFVNPQPYYVRPADTSKPKPVK